MKSKIRFGIIGCSSIAERITIPAILEAKNAHLQRIGSRDPVKAERFAKEFSCRSYGDYTDIMEDNSVDAVYISLPPELQADIIIKSAKAGKHIICEKSATTSFATARKIIKVCERNQVRLMEGFSFRFHPQHEKILTLVNQKPLVKPFAFISKFLIPMKKSNNNFRFRKELGGGALNDLGCYIICASRILFNNNPISVNCRLFSEKHNAVDTHGSISLQFPDNRRAFGVFGYNSSFQSNYEVLCSNGSVFSKLAYNIKKKKSAVIDLHTNNKTRTFRLQPVSQSKLMIDIFCAELKGKRSAIGTFEEDLLVQANIMDASRVSSEVGKSVKIKEIQMKARNE